jgi:peptide deformylase
MIHKINSVFVPEEKALLQMVARDAEGLTQEVEALVYDLRETAAEHIKDCIGLSSNQIWKDPTTPPIAVFIAVMQENRWGVFINPKIIKRWNKEVTGYEGCMSVPGRKEIVTRARHIQVAYRDHEWNEVNGLHLFDFQSRLFQHEYDHLQGKLIYDR